MEAALDYYRKFPLSANMNIKEVCKVCPIKSYEFMFSQGSITYLFVTDKDEKINGKAFSKGPAMFRAFLLDHAKESREEFLTFLDDFLGRLGNDVSLKGLSKFEDSELQILLQRHFHGN